MNLLSSSKHLTNFDLLVKASSKCSLPVR